MKTSGTKSTRPAANPAVSASLNPWLPAAIFLAVATVASLMLSLKHIWAIDLVGCGQGGGCDEVIRGKWGTLAGFPVAFVGLAYFGGWLVFCLLSRRSPVPSWLRLVVALGCLVSLLYIGVMVADGRYCIWCLTSHAANLAFAALLFTRFRFGNATLPRIAATAAVLAGILLLLASRWTYASQKETVSARESARAAESIAQIAAPTEESKRFGGRFWMGAKDAAVRIVVFHDYRCELCYEADGQLLSLLNSRVDVALSYKQWPFDSSCNEQMHGSNPHPTACLAAKAVEAAGIVGGARAYWSMHTALLQAHDITPRFISAQAAQLGLDTAKFMATVQSPQVDSLIQSDINEGLTYGLAFTPLIFVNGYPVRGWQTVGALPDAITRAAQFAKQQPKSSDQPDSAAFEQLQIWRATAATPLPKDQRAPLLGSSDAPNTIVMFGDLTCPFNAAAMAMLKPIIVSHPDTKLIYYNFPLDLDCNPLVKQQINQFACEATRIVEAIRIEKGDAAYRQAALWVIANQPRIGAAAMADLGQQFGLDASGVAALLSNPKAAAVVKADMDRAVALNVTTSPTIYINGKLLSSWRIPGAVQKILNSLQPRS